MMAAAENDPRRAGTIWTLNFDDPVPAIKPLVPVKFKRVGLESSPALVVAFGDDISMEVQQRFDTGRRCYTAWVDGNLAAYGWASFDEEFVGELGLRLKLQPGEAYIWDCFTAPAYRRLHLYSALLVYIIEELRTDRINRIWIGADLENVASQRGIARAGFRRVADLLVSRVLARRQLWVQGEPGMPESLVADARRVFLDNRDSVWLAALSAATRGE